MLNFRSRLLASSLLVGAGLLASPAFAQDAAQPTTTPSPPDNSATPQVPETTTPVEGQTTVPSTSATGETVRAPQDIVITGTRIPQPNLTSASPVTVISSQEVKLQGTTRTEDLINSLPQSFAAQGSNVSNGSTGTATVNLRGLGSVRTLVLINGRRLMAGDPRVPVPDINFVPSALIKRVDVLTGGASSVYGADAVAGVVNFIMDTNFRGLRVDAQASTFWHHQHTNDDVLNANAARGFRPPRGDSVNGGTQDIAAAFGAGFDDNRGSILAYATYRKQDPVLQSSRDYSFCSLTARPAPVPSGSPPRSVNCGGSATSNIATIITSGASGTSTFFVTDQGTLSPGFVPFNFAPYNFFMRPDERYTLGAFAEYEISPGAKPYLEAMFMDDTSVAQIAPSGDFFNTGSLNCDNPLLTAQQLSIICGPGNTFVDQFGVTRGIAYVGRRNVEGGGRQDHTEHLDYRIVGGVRGDLLRGLSYDAYYQFGTTRFTQNFINDMSVTRLGRALDVILDPRQDSPTFGQPVCRSAVQGIDAACVPYNIFAAGGVTQAALNYLQVPGFSRGNVDETIANANFTVEGGEYGIQTPWSDRGVGLNVGAEYRKEALDFRVDQAFQSGDLSGQGGPINSVAGHFDVRELFTEVQLPIVSHSFFEELTLGAGYRYSDYKVGGHHFSTDTYKLSLEFAPIRDVRLRGSYNRAVRAPNVVELFAVQAVGLAGTADPCAGQAPSASLAQCQLTGVSAAQYGHVAANPAGQYNAFAGGNPELAPETANTYTVGLVLQPRFIPGLALTADYFDIKVADVIGVIGFNTIMTQCLTTSDPFFCSRIHRANGTGSLWLPVANVANGGFIVDTNSNLGSLRTRGVDVNGSYSRRLGGMGTLNLSMVGTYLKDLILNPFGDIKFNCASFYGLQCGTPNPKWRHKLRIGFTLPNGIGISGQWRYFSSVKDDTLSSDPDLKDTANPARPFDQKLNAKSFFDLALTARLADRYNFRLGVNNLLDTDPPLASNTASGPYGARTAPPFGNGNTYPQVYDSMGRFLFAGVTVDF
jgi:outer membrane receptor protein involved in Fe transport